MSFTSLDKFIASYLILFDAILNVTMFLNFPFLRVNYKCIQKK